MIKVWAPYPVDYFRDWFGTNNSEFAATKNKNEVLTQDLKIACLPAFFNHGHMKLPDTGTDVSKFDLVLISDIEFTTTKVIEAWVKTLPVDNVLVSVGGVEQYSVVGNYVYTPWWVFNYLNQNEFKDTNQHFDKPYDFDILLGAKKSHRSLIMALLQKNNMLDKNIVTYRDSFTTPQQQSDLLESLIDILLQGEPLRYPYVSPNLKPEWEVKTEITYDVSDKSPWAIYEQTNYSVIAETVYERVFFFSEKAAKVLFAKRPFVVFSSQFYLEYLKSLGFKTFDCIIDESYDLESNPIRRFNMAFQQLKCLAELDYNQIMHQTESIREHNYQRLFALRKEIQQHKLEMVYNKLKEIKHANSIF